MTLTVENQSLMISGELNFSTAVSLWKESIALFHSSEINQIDFSKVNLTNSVGLALLLGWSRYAKKHGKKLLFSHLPPQLLSIAKVAGVEKFISI